MNSTLTDYDPEDTTFWERTGRHIANRNLLISCVCLALAFVVWFYWSILVLYLNDVGFDLTTGQILALMGVPMVTGATLRIVYSFVIPIFGGRNWTVVSTASLLVPTIGIGMVVQDPTTSYTTLLILAGFCGLGGGNFASSMANIGPFYPKRLQGLVLGANAGLGNLGVSILQLVAPLTLGFALYEPLTGAPQAWSGGPSEVLFLQNAAYIWVVPIVASTVAAYFFMNNLRAIHFPLREQTQVFRNKHLYIITTLYVMSFGTFVGFSALFPLLSQMYFPETVGQQWAFLGPMIGSLIRPLGGWVSDRLGGGLVTFWTTIVKITAALGIIHFLPTETRSFAGFFLTFLMVFLMSGIANASIFKMVPFIFPSAQSGVVLGFSSAIASYGAFAIPELFSWSLDAYDNVIVALWWIVGFYVFYTGLMWWHYVRKNAPIKC